jgi:hypothetical protein
MGFGQLVLAPEQSVEPHAAAYSNTLFHYLFLSCQPCDYRWPIRPR